MTSPAQHLAYGALATAMLAIEAMCWRELDDLRAKGWQVVGVPSGSLYDVANNALAEAVATLGICECVAWWEHHDLEITASNGPTLSFRVKGKDLS